jgi:Flp pilus assembly protein TadB
MPSQKKDIKELAREYLEKLKREQEVSAEAKEKEKKPDEDKRVEDERMKADEKEKEKKIEKDKTEKLSEEKHESEDKKLKEDLEKRKWEAAKRKEEEKKRIEVERLIFLKEDEEKANAEKRKITEERKIEIKEEKTAKQEEEKTAKKEEEKTAKQKVPKVAGRAGGITKNIVAVITSPILAVVKIIQQVLISINKVVRMVVGVVTKVIGIIIGTIFKIITTVITAFIPALTWVTSALIKLFSIIWSVVRGFQDNLINTVTSKSKQITPKKITTSIDGMIVYGGVNKTSSQIISTTAIYGVVFSLFAGAVAYALHLPGILILGAFIAGFAIIFVLIFIILSMMADKRAEAVDQVLPDILQIVSVNMVAGMTPYNSLLVAARPEFGPLAEEIHKAVQDTLSGKPLIASLEEMATRVRSDKLRRCVKLMVQGMNSGGELSTVLQEIAKDIRYMQNLEKEMKANTTGFSMFILFAIVIGAPLLLGVSITFVEIFSAIFATIDVGSMGEAAQASMISLEGLSITPDFFWMYAVFVLTISGFFGGLMIGVLQSGKMSSGITTGPALAVVAVLIFIVLHRVLISVFGSAIISV